MSTSWGSYSHGKCMRISTRSCPAWVWTSDAYLACCGPMCETWSILSLMPVSLVKRWPISASFLSEAGAKLFQQRYEISRCWPRAGGTRVARIPARPPPVVVRKRRRLIGSMAPPFLAMRGRTIRSGERECRQRAPGVKARRGSRRLLRLADRAGEPLLEHHVERRDEDQREEGRDEQAADDRDRQRLVRLRADPERERHRQQADDGREDGHENGAQAGPPGPRGGDAQGLAVAAPLVDVLDEEHAVGDDDADHHDDAHERRRGEGRVREVERPEDADEPHGHGEHDRERILERAELRREHHVHEQDREEGGEGEAREGLPLLLGLAPEADREAGRQREPTELRLELLRDRAEVAAHGVGRDADETLLVLPLDLHRTRRLLDVRDRGQEDGAPVVRRHEDPPQILRRPPVRLVELDDDIVLVARPRVGEDRRADARVGVQREEDGLRDPSLEEARGRRLLAVDRDLELWVVRVAADRHVGDAARGRHDAGELAREGVRRAEVVAEDLDLERRVGPEVDGPGHQAARDEAIRRAGKLPGEAGPERGDDLPVAPLALVRGREVDLHTGAVRARVAGEDRRRPLRDADVRDDRDQLLCAQLRLDDRLHRLDDPFRLLDPRAHRRLEVDAELRLVRLREELPADQRPATEGGRGHQADAHDNHTKFRASGPGEDDYMAQLHAYDQAFGAFFDRLALDGINKSNTLFVFTSDENDHFAGGNSTNGTWSHTYCNISAGQTCPANQIGEVEQNLNELLPTGYTPPAYDAHFDSAPTIYVSKTGTPPTTSDIRRLERNLASANAIDPYVNPAPTPVMLWIADRVGEKALHMVNADPRRTPDFTYFANPDYFLTTGNNRCIERPATLNVASCIDYHFAYSHGDATEDIGRTWLGLVGPGVQNLGRTSATWSDHADTRPTMLALLGLKDSYEPDGAVLADFLQTAAVSRDLRAHHESLVRLHEVYKDIAAPFGPFAHDTLVASTHAIASGSASDDSHYTSVEHSIASLTSQRDALEAGMRTALTNAAFGGGPTTEQDLKRMIAQGQQLLSEASALAASS